MNSLASMTIQQRRELLDSAKGGFFSVSFVKKDGTLREMTCKKWIETAFAHGSKNAAPSTTAHKPEYYSAVDMKSQQFRTINLETLQSVKVNGNEFVAG